MSILQRCQSYRESNKVSKERKGPTLGVHFTEVSVLKTVRWEQVGSNMGEKTGSATETRVSPSEGGTPQNGLHGEACGGFRGGARAPLLFRPNWGPKGGKKFLEAASPPYLRVWMTGHHPPPLIWRSGSVTVDPALKGYLFQASKGRNFTSWSIWKGRENCHSGP